MNNLWIMMELENILGSSRRYLEEKTTLTMLIMKLAEYADSPFSSSIDALFPTTIWEWIKILFLKSNICLKILEYTLDIWLYN